MSAHLDALGLHRRLRERLVDFALADNHVRDDALRKACELIWQGPPEQGGLVSQIWVEGVFPAETSEATLDDLVGAGTLPASLRDQLNHESRFPHDRRLFCHQLEAVKRAAQEPDGAPRPGLVVTAPTGAGKTESFLLPMLNELYTRPRAAGTQGTRCIMLYPMNALVNDQVARLDRWLEGQRDVRLFHFTGETPEDHVKANEIDLEVGPHRFRTRQEARGLAGPHGGPGNGTVPDIVVTNYSMLEYMLCRPQDSVFFGGALQCIILDEAHMYTGTLAAEIMLLLRRVLDRCGKRSDQVLHVATSATLGGDEANLRDYASVLFSKSTESIVVVRGNSARIELGEAQAPATAADPGTLAMVAWPDTPTVITAMDGTPCLAEGVQLAPYKRILGQLVGADILPPDETGCPAKVLHAALRHSPLLAQLSQFLWEQRDQGILALPLQAVAAELWGSYGDDEAEATRRILELGASARSSLDSLPLVPHRMHVLVSPPSSLTLCLAGDCTGPKDLSVGGLGAVNGAGRDHCAHCGAATLTLCRCSLCGEWALAGRRAGGTMRPAPPTDLGGRGPADDDDDDLDADQACMPCTVLGLAEAGNESYNLAPRTGVVTGAGGDGVPLRVLGECPRCEASGDRAWVPFCDRSSGSSLTLSIVAETALSQMPTFPGSLAPLLPAQGRRLLAFSDSRSEAARLGPRLTAQHQDRLIRWLALSGLMAAPVDPQDLEAWQGMAERARAKGQIHQEAERNLAAAREGLLVETIAQELLGGDYIEHIAQLSADTEPDDFGSGWDQQAWDDHLQRVRRQIPAWLCAELGPRRNRQRTLETAGLMEVRYPLLDTMEAPAGLRGGLPAAVANALADCWSDLLRFLCDDLRRSGCLTLGQDADDAFNSDFQEIGRWCAEDSRGYLLEPFVGQVVDDRPFRAKRLQFAESVLREAGLASDDAHRRAPDLLRAAFGCLARLAQDHADGWLQSGQRADKRGHLVTALRVDARQLAFARPARLFQSAATGAVWPRSVLRCAPGTSDLRETTPEALDKDPQWGRIRWELSDPEIVGQALWAVEHSAQLDSAPNRKHQDLFRRGALNILSATTTLELGIDIGGLSGVLLANVPPSKSNYMQRAGRAGRRSDGSSVVISYCRPRPYDREVLSSFGAYLSKELRAPRVLTDRSRVALRHAQACLVGAFFHEAYYEPGQAVGAMNAFGSMGGFTGRQAPNPWGENAQAPQRPEPGPSVAAQLSQWLLDQSGNAYRRRRVRKVLDGTPVEIVGDNWEALLRTASDSLVGRVESWQAEYDAMLDDWSEAVAANRRRMAKALWFQLVRHCKIPVIAWLADAQYLPKYGFPVGVVRLQVMDPEGRGKQLDGYKLDRPGLLAVGEYVPGSRLVVGGKVVTSRGLAKHWTGANIGEQGLGERLSLATCPDGHSFHYPLGHETPCPLCEQARAGDTSDLLLPVAGFSTAYWDPPKRGSVPDRVGSSMTFTVAWRPESAGRTFQDLGGVGGFNASYREDGELLSYNLGDSGAGFIVCLQCGFSTEDKPRPRRAHARDPLPTAFQGHRPLHRPRDGARACRYGQSYWRRVGFAARQVTDVALFELPLICGPRNDLAVATTLGHALRLGGARVLQVDPREIGMLATPAAKGIAPVLYDNVSGGAGHVLELLDRHAKEWLREALRVMWVSDTHHDRCETACLDCLLTFEAQDAAARDLLCRRRAHEVLAAMLEGAG